jgi:hypothetical protein
VPPSHEYFVYDGRVFVGRVTMKGETGEARAFDAKGKSLGKFASPRDASRAVSAVHNAAVGVPPARAEAARRRLLEPVGFVSGLPDHFIAKPCWRPRPASAD